MEALTHYPIVLCSLTFLMLSLIAMAGAWMRGRFPTSDEGQNEHLGIIVAATLTLLGLIVGFSFSVAANRYDQRKNFEEQEADAIGTEILRTDFLPSSDAANVHKLLHDYIQARVALYINSDDQDLAQLNGRTAQLQAAL